MKRTAEKIEQNPGEVASAVRFTDYNRFARHPSSELLGYYHSSANAD